MEKRFVPNRFNGKYFLKQSIYNMTKKYRKPKNFSLMKKSKKVKNNRKC